jgi:hypothetical protein
MGGYYVHNNDWPSGASDNDMSAEEVFAILDDLDPYLAAAQRSFGEASDE